MFLGDYKKKRSINLGGTKATLDKSLLINQAAVERQKREKERQAITSAFRIQVIPPIVCRCALIRRFRERGRAINVAKRFTSQLGLNGTQQYLR